MGDQREKSPRSRSGAASALEDGLEGLDHLLHGVSAERDGLPPSI